MKRRGFTLIELLVVVAIIALLIAILLPSLGKARELSNRSVCAANVRGIGQSMAVYGKDNNDAYPLVVSGTNAKGTIYLATSTGVASGASPDTLLSSTGLYSSSNTKASVPQNMWILVLTGQVAPKQFLCKSDPGQTVTAAAAVGSNYGTNFNNAQGFAIANWTDMAYSYSFAYPWVSSTGAVGGWWRDTTDAGLPLISDMAPFNGALYAGTASNTTNPGVKEANSTNHQRDGQNVGFGDSHAEFARRPDCGESSDNLFTYNSGTCSSSGTAYAGIGTPPAVGGGQGAWDVCVVPASDSGNGYTRK